MYKKYQTSQFFQYLNDKNKNSEKSKFGVHFQLITPGKSVGGRAGDVKKMKLAPKPSQERKKLVVSSWAHKKKIA